MDAFPPVSDVSTETSEQCRQFYQRNHGENVKPVYDKSCVAFVRILPTIYRDQELATFPFTSEYKGEIDLSSYFKPEETDGVFSGTFRGKLLQGEKVNPPPGCITYSALSVDRPNGQKMMNVTGTVKNVLSYEFDRQPGPHCRLQAELHETTKNEWMKPEFSEELKLLTTEERLKVIRLANTPEKWIEHLGQGYAQMSTEDRVCSLKKLAASCCSDADCVVESEVNNQNKENDAELTFAELFPAIASRFEK